MNKSLKRGELILYKTEDGFIEVQLRAFDGTVWLTQREISELFNTSKDNVSLHLKNIYSEGEIQEKATTEESSVVQNKMIWSVTGKTAAELIADRSYPQKPNMGLTSWLGSIVRKKDVAISKNYLSKKEIGELNHIVVMYLDYAELQAKRRQMITMKEWQEKLDAFLKFNEGDLLSHAGQIKAEVAKKLAEDRYERFDTNRKNLCAIEADEDDMKELELLVKKLENNKKDEK